MLEKRVYVTTSLENKKGSCVEIHVFIGTVYIQYDSRVSWAVKGTAENNVVFIAKLLLT